MPIPDTSKLFVEIVVKGLITGGGSNSINTVNVFHFRRTTNVNPIGKASVDAAFQTAIGDLIFAALNLRWSQLTNEVRFIEDAEDAYGLVDHVNVGSITGDSMNTMSSVFLYCRSNVRGRNWQGSKKLGPISESDTTTGSSDVLNAGAITRFSAIATAISSGFTDGNGNVKVRKNEADPSAKVDGIIAMIMALHCHLDNVFVSDSFGFRAIEW